MLWAEPGSKSLRGGEGEEAAMAGGGGDSVSARALARSVAHRLKYYIDVQRKEHSFDSSGSIRDEMESSSSYTHPVCLIEQGHGQPQEHDFAEIKLEAFLRTYMGSTKQCYQKVQESPEKQKELEKFIKEKAKDYVPDQTNEGRAKKTQRQSYWLRTPSSLHRTAVPSMSAEELRRLVSSASKLIVAATSEVSPKVLGTTREVVSAPKRRATKTFPRLGCAWKQSLSSTQPFKDEAESSVQECHEDFRTELNQKASEKNGRKKPKSTKKRKNMKYRDRTTEMSSNLSCNSYESNKMFSTRLPKSDDSCSASVSFPSLYSPPGQNKVFRKGILKNRRSASCTSSAIPEYQDIEPDSRWKGYLHPSGGHSAKLVEMKRKKSSCTPIGEASRRKSSRSSSQPVLTSRNTPEIRNNVEVCSVKQMAEVTHAQSSKVRKKTEKTYSSKEVSGCAVLNQPGKFSGKSQRGWSEETKGGQNSASEKNSECHRVHFQMFQQWYHPKNVEQNSDSCSLVNLRNPENTTLPIASVDESGETLACLQEDQGKDHILTAECKPSLGYQVCQGEDLDATVHLAMNQSMNINGPVGNQDIESHSGNLLNQILSLNEADAKDVRDPSSHMQINDLILEEPWDQQVVYIPSMLLGVGDTSGQGGGSSASSGMSTPIPGRLGNGDSSEEFTISSASSHLSAKSFASTERNRNAKLEEGEENADPSADIRVPNAMQESMTVQQGTFDQHNERLSSSAEGKRTNEDCGPENTSAARVVYFSHLPMSL